jgi:hypothetical protein
VDYPFKQLHEEGRLSLPSHFVYQTKTPNKYAIAGSNTLDAKKYMNMILTV